jgi:ribosomal protein L40E
MTTSINRASTMSWMSSIRARLIYVAVVLAAVAAVAGYAAWSGGRTSVPFLAGATAALGWVVWLAFSAAQALVKDAPVVDAGAVVTGKRRKELEREKQALLKALKELDFDHQMGKVSDKDFADISATYRARAIRVMRQLDDAGRDYEAMIRDDVGKRLSAVSSQPSASEQKPEPDRCAKCGTRNDGDADFCKKCGGKLVREAS